jgi:N-acetylmuramoyl-L-alanine amidase
MTFYHNNRSQELAQRIQNSLIGETGADNKGIQTASFHVIRNTIMPSVLVETGFLSNVAEAKLLAANSYQNNIANGIFNGIARYFTS